MRRRIFRRPSNWIPRTKCGAWQMEGTEKKQADVDKIRLVVSNIFP